MIYSPITKCIMWMDFENLEIETPVCEIVDIPEGKRICGINENGDFMLEDDLPIRVECQNPFADIEDKIDGLYIALANMIGGES